MFAKQKTAEDAVIAKADGTLNVREYFRLNEKQIYRGTVTIIAGFVCFGLVRE